MAKNRPKIWFSHLVDMLIFFESKIFLSIFWLENWLDVVKHSDTPVLQLWRGLWLFTGRKVVWTAKKRNHCFLPRCTPTKQISTFMIIIAKVRPLPTFSV